jgi:uncharacterized membrane protein affecting hemolysin expression
MDSPHCKLLSVRGSLLASSLSKGQILLIALLCTPILVTIIFLAMWYHQQRAKERSEVERAEAILRPRAQTAAYEAHALSAWEIDNDRVRTLAILEGLVAEREVTERSLEC